MTGTNSVSPAQAAIAAARTAVASRSIESTHVFDTNSIMNDFDTDAAIAAIEAAKGSFASLASRHFTDAELAVSNDILGQY